MTNPSTKPKRFNQNRNRNKVIGSRARVRASEIERRKKAEFYQAPKEIEMM